MGGRRGGGEVEGWEGGVTLADYVLAGGRPRLPGPQQDEDRVLREGLEVLSIFNLV